MIRTFYKLQAVGSLTEIVTVERQTQRQRRIKKSSAQFPLTDGNQSCFVMKSSLFSGVCLPSFFHPVVSCTRL